MSQSQNAPRLRISRKKKLVFTVVSSIVFGLLVYGGIAVWRTKSIYRYVKAGHRGWTGDVYQADPELGYSPVPGGSGAETYPIGPDVPARIDQNGFRIPVNTRDASESDHRSKVLALGCSFTYGSSCLAEETYPYLVASRLKARCLNAGICGAGLAQMTILAKRLIPKHRPDVVLVQYSPWLVDRALSPFAPTYWETYPVPYFVKSSDGQFVIRQPVFLAGRASKRASKYRNSKKGKIEFLRFFLNVGLPHCMHEDTHLGWYKLKLVAGQIARPTTDRTGLIQDVYGEINSLCRKFGAKMIIVGMRDNFDNNASMPVESFPRGVPVVDTGVVLARKLPQPTNDAWRKAYFHWRGDPPVVVDGHPNPVAHRIISDVVLKHARDSSRTVSERSASISRIDGG